MRLRDAEETGWEKDFKPCSNNSNGHVVSRRISMVPGDWCFVDRDMRSSGAHMDESNFKSSMTDYRNATKVTTQRAVAQGYLVQNALQGTPSYAVPSLKLEHLPACLFNHTLQPFLCYDGRRQSSF